jgi:hypothetical protein
MEHRVSTNIGTPYLGIVTTVTAANIALIAIRLILGIKMKSDLERFRDFFTEMGVPSWEPQWYRPHITVGHTDFVFDNDGSFVEIHAEGGRYEVEERLTK